VSDRAGLDSWLLARPGHPSGTGPLGSGLPLSVGPSGPVLAPVGPGPFSSPPLHCWLSGTWTGGEWGDTPTALLSGVLWWWSYSGCCGPQWRWGATPSSHLVELPLPGVEIVRSTGWFSRRGHLSEGGTLRICFVGFVVFCRGLSRSAR
jgi:hypothetical protein